MSAAESRPPDGPTPTILVGYDGSPGAERALRWALREATLRKAAIHVLQSWHEPVLSRRSWHDRWEDPAFEERAAATALRRSVDAARASYPGVPCTSEVTETSPAAALTERSPDHELVVVGSRGHGGFAALTLGSVAEHVAGAAPVSVAVIGHRAPGLGQIVVGVDGSTGSRRALLWAAEEGRVRSAPVRAAMAWTARPPFAARGAEPFGAAANEEDARLALHRTVAEQLGTAGAGDIQRVIHCAPAAKVLIETGEGAALLVLGAATSGPSLHRLGAVSRQVLRHAPCPVVIAR